MQERRSIKVQVGLTILMIPLSLPDLHSLTGDMALFENFQKLFWATVYVMKETSWKEIRSSKSTWKYTASSLGLGNSVKFNTKVTESAGKTPQSQASGRDSLKTVVRLNFRPEAAEKWAPQCLAWLDDSNCSYCQYNWARKALTAKNVVFQ